MNAPQLNGWRLKFKRLIVASPVLISNQRNHYILVYIGTNSKHYNSNDMHTPNRLYIYKLIVYFIYNIHAYKLIFFLFSLHIKIILFVVKSFSAATFYPAVPTLFFGPILVMVPSVVNSTRSLNFNMHKKLIPVQ